MVVQTAEEMLWARGEVADTLIFSVFYGEQKQLRLYYMTLGCVQYSFALK